MRFRTSLLALLLAGCAATPQPNPPTVEPSIDVEQLLLHNASDDRIAIHGKMGALSPPGSSLQALNLVSTDPLGEVVSRDDGSVLVLLPGGLFDLFRIQARNAELWSVPLDVEGFVAGPFRCFAFDEAAETRCSSHADEPSCLTETDCLWGSPDGTLLPQSDPPPLGCFGIDPYSELIFPNTSTSSSHPLPLDLNNNCDEDVTISATLRLGDVGYSVVDPGPLTIPAGESGQMTILFEPLVPGLSQDIAFLDLSSPSTLGTRRSISLRGEGL